MWVTLRKVTARACFWSAFLISLEAPVGGSGVDSYKVCTHLPLYVSSAAESRLPEDPKVRLWDLPLSVVGHFFFKMSSIICFEYEALTKPGLMQSLRIKAKYCKWQAEIKALHSLYYSCQSL